MLKTIELFHLIINVKRFQPLKIMQCSIILTCIKSVKKRFSMSYVLKIKMIQIVIGE